MITCRLPFGIYVNIVWQWVERANSNGHKVAWLGIIQVAQYNAAYYLSRENLFDSRTVSFFEWYVKYTNTTWVVIFFSKIMARILPSFSCTTRKRFVMSMPAQKQGKVRGFCDFGTPTQGSMCQTPWWVLRRIITLSEIACLSSVVDREVQMNLIGSATISKKSILNLCVWECVR